MGKSVISAIEHQDFRHPAEQCSPDEEISIMEFDGLHELQTGSSLKQRGANQLGLYPDTDRITTTEAQDIFDEEDIWNMSGYFQVAEQDPTITANPCNQE